MKAKFLWPIVLLSAVFVGSVCFWPQSSPSKPAAAARTERKILYYQSPMHPWIRSDKPGKCPICGMDMVPVYESPDTTNAGPGLKLSADSVSVANVQTAVVDQRPIVRIVRVAGTISANSATGSWFEFDAYERDVPWLKPGQTIEVTMPGIPGKSLTAEIKWRGAQPYTDQNFDPASDSTKVRAEIAGGPVSLGDFGPGKWFTGLYAEGSIHTETPEVLAVPRTAVLSPGPQPIVYVDEAGGRYAPRKVKLGRIGDEFAEVLDGLKEGEKVVTSGNLLIDSETQISQAANN